MRKAPVDVAGLGDEREGELRQLRDFTRQDHGGVVEEIHLIGQPPLHKFLHFIEQKAEWQPPLDKRALIAEWRVANEYLQTLEESEPGLADKIDVQPLDPAMAPLAKALAEDARFRLTFDEFGTSFAMVKLDMLTLYQTHVTRDFTDGIARRLGANPSPEALFGFCQPTDVPQPPVQIRKVGSSRYQFTSDSTDFRPHDPVLLRPEQVVGHETFGPMSAVLGLVVGYGSNFLTGIRRGDDGRILLHNGYHRSYALRALGITHAPMIIRTVLHDEELGVAAASRVANDVDFYFNSARPPMLKDFFDGRLSKALRVYRTKKLIEISFEIKEHSLGV
jgi:hypothetical protein